MAASEFYIKDDIGEIVEFRTFCVKFPILQADFSENIWRLQIKSVSLQILESATLPIEQRTRAELFVYMRMEYTNPPLDTAILLANLQNEHHGKSVVKHKLKIDIKCHFSIHIAFA